MGETRFLPVPYTLKERVCLVCGRSFSLASPDCLEEFCLVRGIENPETLGPWCAPCFVQDRLRQGWRWQQITGSQALRLAPPSEDSHGGEIDSTGL